MGTGFGAVPIHRHSLGDGARDDGQVVVTVLEPLLELRSVHPLGLVMLPGDGGALAVEGDQNDLEPVVVEVQRPV